MTSVKLLNTNMKQNIMKIYLDYNATTPTDQSIVDEIIPVFKEKFGNPSSESHDTGKIARDLVDKARVSVAGIVGMRPSDVIFTSGATEANNLVFFGFTLGNKKPLKFLVGATEHKSVLEPCEFLKKYGIDIVKIPVNTDGTINIDKIDDIILNSPSDTYPNLISVMAANSETGVINDISSIVKRAHALGALVHCDATQAIGKIPFNADDIGVDMVTFSSHKIYGPKGCGALVATRHARKMLQGILYGGGQENNMRSGTLNVPGIVGFGKACDIAISKMPDESARQKELRDYFEQEIIKSIPNVSINGKGAPRLPNTSNIQITGAIADAVIIRAPEIEIATGSACSSAAMEPSHVLTAMKLSADAANESIRISLGRDTSAQDIDIAVKSLNKAALLVRELESKDTGVN